MSRGEEHVVPVEDAILQEVRSLAIQLLAPLGAVVYLFGSWARGTQRRTSDIDLAVEAAVPLPPAALSRLREAFEESAIPYRVQVVDLADVDTDFRERVHVEGRRWTDSVSA